MSLNILGRRYLDAYVNCFEKPSSLGSLLTLQDFIDKILTTKGFYNYLLSPSVSQFDKKVSIQKVISKDDKILSNFISLIISKNRVSLFSVLNDVIIEKINDIKNTVSADVYSSTRLTSNDKNQIAHFLEKELNKTVIINEIIDESILAGFKIEVQKKVYDVTLDASLERLKSSFK